MLVLENYEQAVLLVCFSCIKYIIYACGCTLAEPLEPRCLLYLRTATNDDNKKKKKSSTFIISPGLTGHFAEVRDPPAHFSVCVKLWVLKGLCVRCHFLTSLLWPSIIQMFPLAAEGEWSACSLALVAAGDGLKPSARADCGQSASLEHRIRIMATWFLSCSTQH